MAPTWSRALVTGASAGIGTSFARKLAEAGTDLVLVARRTDAMEALAAELQSAHGIAVEVLTADLTDPEALAVVEKRLAADEDPIDLLVNNAGFGTKGRFEELEIERLHREINLNVTAVVRLAHAAAATMQRRGRGGIINVASMVGFNPTPYMAVYGATKAFVISFSEAIHEELKATGVHVSVLCPGATRTEFADEAGVDESTLPGFLWMDADPVAELAIAGVTRNRAVVVPGAMNKAGAVMIRSLPTLLSRKGYAFAFRRGED